MQAHPIVSREAWLTARKALLEEERALTRAHDRVAAARRALPWVRIDTPYVFDTPAGPRRLAELFDGRSQLVVQHFMFGPDDAAGCPSCSFLADHVDGANLHLSQHDVTYVAVARAPLARLEAYRRRMGWRFPFVSSGGSEFNFDFGVSFRKEDLAAGNRTYNYGTEADDRRYVNEELHGLSVFVKDAEGTVFHTYSTYARGVDALMGAYQILDLTPLGRNEAGAEGHWLRRHDEYEGAAPPACCGGAARAVA